MYNGIGLATPRGSATSGHVTKNLSHVSKQVWRDKLNQTGRGDGDRADGDLPVAKISKDIMDHNRKRAIESQLVELQEEMLELGYTDEEIQEKLDSKRSQLEKQAMPSTKSSSSTDSHTISTMKTIGNANMRDALGLSKTRVDEMPTKKQDQSRIIPSTDGIPSKKSKSDSFKKS